jgi:mannose-6-phosphate isomerase
MRFAPVLREVLWGGRNLERIAGRRLPPERPIGESWEIADFVDRTTGREHSSIIDNGPLAGRTIRQAAAELGPEFLGRSADAEGRFPLLVKYLDVVEPLSVQVHPDERSAAAIGNGAAAKSECWYILSAGEGGRLYRGVKPGTTAEQLRAAAGDGSIEALLLREPAVPGEAVLVPGGTIHAAAGVVALEFQQPSDTVYRLFDWNRTDPATGKPRPLQLEPALTAASLDRPPPPPTRFRGGFDAAATLIECPAFTVREIRSSGWYAPEWPGTEARVWAILRGKARIETVDGQSVEAKAGDVLLMPADMADFTAVSEGVLHVVEAVPR